jgi:hypothetical protein
MELFTEKNKVKFSEIQKAHLIFEHRKKGDNHAVRAA